MTSGSKRNREYKLNNRKKRVGEDEQNIIRIDSNSQDDNNLTADIQVISVKKYVQITADLEIIDDDIHELDAFSSIPAQSTELDRTSEPDVLLLRDHSVPSTSTAFSQIPQNAVSSSSIDPTYHDLDAAMARALQEEEYIHAQPQSIPLQRQAMVDLGLDEATINSFLMEENGGLFNQANYIDDNNMDLSYEGLLALSERIGSVKPKGLPEYFIMNLARKKFREKDTLIEDKQCVICMTDYIEKECLCGLPCCHYFHESCIAVWLKESRLCPICRLDVEKTLK